MKIQSIDSGSFYQQPEVKARIFSERRGVKLTEAGVQFPVQAGDQVNEVTTPQRLDRAVDIANRTLETYGTELRFSIHESSGEIMVQVINTKDDSVIREIPSERVLDFVANVKKMLGIIIDKLI
jgi:flagellar protein FlaG